MNDYGSDFITITDEDGTDYEMEVLDTLEHNGITYMAVCDATLGEEAQEVEYTLLKVVVETARSFWSPSTTRTSCWRSTLCSTSSGRKRRKNDF